MTASGSAPRRLSPLTPVAQTAILVVAAAWTAGRDALQEQGIGVVGLIFLALLIGGGLAGAASWWRTTFWITEDELRIDIGLLSRTSRRIRIDRLQAIDIRQPFVARLLGLAELKFDTAGDGDEGSLEFLRLSDAEELRDALLQRRDEIAAPRSAQQRQAPPPETATATATGSNIRQPVLWRVDAGDLLWSAVASGETLVVLGSLTTLAVVTLGFGARLGWELAVIGLPVLGGYAAQIASRVTHGWDYAVRQTPDGLQVSGGLLDRRTQSLRLQRVQGVRLREPLLWRRFGWARLDVSMAGLADSRSDDHASSVVVPVADRAAAMRMARMLIGGLDPAAVALRPTPRRAVWLAPLQRRRLAFGQDETLVAGRHGRWTRELHVVPHARVQSVRVTQGPMQRILRLATVRIDSPPGVVAVRGKHREAHEARGAFDAEVGFGIAARRGLRAPDRWPGAATPR